MEKGSKLLRGNWVEAKATEGLDPDIEVGFTIKLLLLLNWRRLEKRDAQIQVNSKFHANIQSSGGLYYF